jgi:agmatine/peptidylarginine deiminase
VTHTLLPEWQAIDAVILAWPHEDTDWAPWLNTVKETYISLIHAINAQDAGVILLCRAQDCALIQASLDEHSRVLMVVTDYNDTWVRDYAFLTCGNSHTARPIEFTFNGWGQKFDATDDNGVNQRILASLCQGPMLSSPVVVEGGALEIDQYGHLLSTASCLFNPLRNNEMTADAYIATFKHMLGCSKVTILHHGHLEGDDTDGHIDTLVRFTPDTGLVIQGALNRPEDDHFAELTALIEECHRQLPDHKQFVLPLPLIRNANGERLPASYANFLICNQAILLPIYQQPEDDEAITTVQRAFPHHQVIPINCEPLIQQFGSLHCVTMQVPCHTLRHSVLEQLNQGVTRYVANNP